LVVDKHQAALGEGLDDAVGFKRQDSRANQHAAGPQVSNEVFAQQVQRGAGQVAKLKRDLFLDALEPLGGGGHAGGEVVALGVFLGDLDRFGIDVDGDGTGGGPQLESGQCEHPTTTADIEDLGLTVIAASSDSHSRASLVAS
jgi:hypothetical protein